MRLKTWKAVSLVLDGKRGSVRILEYGMQGEQGSISLAFAVN
jgi:hypothetical protein